jgi:hypothetical protein
VEGAGSQVEEEHPTSNIEHRTSKLQRISKSSNTKKGILEFGALMNSSFDMQNSYEVGGGGGFKVVKIG